MRPPSIWKTLGISRTQDRTDIRRAYAKKLKVTNPEDDPEGFKVLRAAYEEALDYADNRYVPPEPENALEEETEQDAVEVASGQAITEAAPAEVYEAEPPPVDVVAEAYFAACDRLEKQLKARSSASDDDRKATLDTILSSPMLDNIETRDNAEQWLAQLVSRSQPRADILIPRLVERFGWNGRRIDRHQTWAVRQVLQRETDLGFLRYCRQADDSNHDAWVVLSQPPQPVTLWRRLMPKASRSDIRNFLSAVRGQYPTVEPDLNADAVRVWEERLEQRDIFEGFSLWMMVLTPIAILAMLVLWLSMDTGPIALLCLPAVPAVAIGGMLAYEFVCGLPRRTWTESWHLQQNKWFAYGWAPAILLLLLLAAAPASPWLTGLVILLSIVIAWWAAVTGEVDQTPNDWPWQLRLAVAEVFLVVWWVMAIPDMPSVSALQLTGPVLAASVVSGFGRLPLLTPWLALSNGIKQSALVLLGLAAIGAIVLVWWLQPYKDLRPLGFTVAALIILLHRVPTLTVQNQLMGLRSVVIFCALFFGRGWADGALAFPFIGSAILGWVAFSCLTSFLADPEKVQK